MCLDDFDFELPRRLIAAHPCEPRDAARLLVIPASGGLQDRRISDLPALLRCGDLLVFNDTKVIPARLIGRRGMASVEVTLHRDLGGGAWRAFAKGARRLRIGDHIVFAEDFVADVAENHPEGEYHCGSSLRGKRFTTRSPATARCRCRPISSAHAAATRVTALTIRRSLPAPRERWRRRPQVCISLRLCSRRWPSATSAGRR